MESEKWRWPGQVVEVRPLDEIMATLDENGCVDGLPFMPEMARFAGRRLTVSRTSSAICVEGLPGLNALPDAVILDDLRCDGSAHDGCQRGCTILWKTEWLRPASSHEESLVETPAPPVEGLKTKIGDRYFCQSTELARATSPIPSMSLRPLLDDLRRGELTIRRFVRITALAAINRILQAARGRGLSASGTQRTTSNAPLGLEHGDFVRIKERDEIEGTLTPEGMNLGLAFEYEMFDRCGETCEVSYPVRRIILEESGKMVQIKNSVVLDGVTCTGLHRRNCPRAGLLYWRESWLERADATGE
jgi:hypothetical protein